MAEFGPRLHESLLRAGYRVTAPRAAVLRTIARMRSPLTAERILARARRIHPRIGLVTVYRTLEILRALGHVHRLHSDTGCNTYAPALASHSHHILCSCCGRAVEMRNCRMLGTLQRMADRSGFRLTAHWLQLVGECPRCRRPRPSVAPSKRGARANA